MNERINKIINFIKPYCLIIGIVLVAGTFGALIYLNRRADDRNSLLHRLIESRVDNTENSIDIAIREAGRHREITAAIQGITEELRRAREIIRQTNRRFEQTNIELERIRADISRATEQSTESIEIIESGLEKLGEIFEEIKTQKMD